MKNNDKSTAHKNLKIQSFLFQEICGKKVEVFFDEQELTSDAGLLPLAEYARDSNAVERVINAIKDTRSGVKHSMTTLVEQKLYQILSGNPDANDSDRMRKDAAIQLSCKKLEELASQPTMSRLENRVNTKDLVRMAYALGENFLDSFDKRPEAIVIDMDPTAHLVYGQQELGLFNTHVGDTCLMPFHVYDGITGQIITSVMRPGKTPTADEILRILKRIVKRIRDRFPKTNLIFRADSHHTKPAVMDWMEENEVHFVTGLSPNSKLNKLSESIKREAVAVYEGHSEEDKTTKVIRRFHSFYYQACSWSCARRVICRVQVSKMGSDIRYIVTDFQTEGARYLYEEAYCGRGEAELFIKEHKLGLQSDRSPCQKATANQFRLFISSLAYQLLHRFRKDVLCGTELASASFTQIRIKCFKVAARVQRLKSKIKIHMPENYAFIKVFDRVSMGTLSQKVPS